MAKTKKIEVLRFSFGDQDYIVENNASSWASFYECFGMGAGHSMEEVTVTVELWTRKCLASLPEWGN